MSLVSSAEVLHITQRALNHIDPRLVEHGERVAYLALRLQRAAGLRDPRLLRDLCMLAVLHDVGAYKTEEIDRMLQFETNSVWGHSVYGYLFLRHLSPLGELAPAILFHHLDHRRLQREECGCKDFAQLLCLCDRLDIYMVGRGTPPPAGYLERWRGSRFSPGILDLLRRAEALDPGLYRPLQDGRFRQEVEACLAACPFESEEINAYLRMMVFSIDFRSVHTVTHTITTERISQTLAGLLGLDRAERYKVSYGALLHDLGKIAIPVEILEFPGKLSPQAMRVMQTHVEMTGEILGESADREMLRIAVRHHEKLDGSGYPAGLTGEDLSAGERIVAVADIVSALYGTRSYKKSFGKERICSILRQMKEDGLLCPRTVDAVLEHYDAIMEQVDRACGPVLETYGAIQGEYERLMERYEPGARPSGGPFAGEKAF